MTPVPQEPSDAEYCTVLLMRADMWLSLPDRNMLNQVDDLVLRTRAGAGVPERIRGQYNRVLSGERLSDATRADFVTQAGGQFKAQLAGYQQLEEQFRGIAGRAGMDPRQIVVESATAAPGGAQKSPLQPSAGWGPVQVMP